VFGGGGSDAEIAQNNTAAVGAKDNISGFNIVMKDLLSMDIGDSVANIGPDTKTPTFGYGEY
jgi:hypothetical protein